MEYLEFREMFPVLQMKRVTLQNK